MWERERYAVNAAEDYLQAAFPPHMSSIHHVVINSYAAKELARRTGMRSTLVPNVMDFDLVRSNRTRSWVRCLLEEDQLGFCGVRKNQRGRLVPLSYGRVAAMHLANVERKPLFHFFPGD